MVDVLLALFCLTCAVVIVVSSNPIVSAVSLLTLFIGLAGVFFQLGAYFMSIVQVLIYAGAIAILFVFVLMLLNLGVTRAPVVRFNAKSVVGFVMITAVFGVLDILVDSNSEFFVIDKMPETSLLKLFETLFSRYLVPFELASMLLLVGIVGSITLARNLIQPGPLK